MRNQLRDPNTYIIGGILLYLLYTILTITAVWMVAK